MKRTLKPTRRHLERLRTVLGLDAGVKGLSVEMLGENVVGGGQVGDGAADLGGVSAMFCSANQSFSLRLPPKIVPNDFLADNHKPSVIQLLDGLQEISSVRYPVLVFLTD